MTHFDTLPLKVRKTVSTLVSVLKAPGITDADREAVFAKLSEHFPPKIAAKEVRVEAIAPGTVDDSCG